MTTVYLVEQPKVGKPIVGWDPRKQQLIVTTPVTRLAVSNGDLLASTEENGSYKIVPGPKKG